jgi:hypothetical protein
LEDEAAVMKKEEHRDFFLAPLKTFVPQLSDWPVQNARNFSPLVETDRYKM